MVAAAPHAHRVLFENAHVRRGLAGIDELQAAAFEQFYHLRRVGGDAAHALQKVERRALAGENGAHIPAHGSELLPLFRALAVLCEKLDLHPRVEQLKGARKHGQPRDDALLLADEFRLTQGGAAQHAVRGYILAGHVLRERHADEFVRADLHGNFVNQW